MTIQLDFFVLKIIFVFLSSWLDKWTLLTTSREMYLFLYSFSKKHIEDYHQNIFHQHREIDIWFRYVNIEDWCGIDYLESQGLYCDYPNLSKIGLTLAVSKLNPTMVYYMLKHDADNIEEALYQLQQLSSKSEISQNKNICQIYYWLIFYQSIHWQKRHLKLMV